MRRFLQFFLLLGGIILLAAATLPWWLGAALRPLAKAQGATFARYERLGYARFRLQGVQFERGSVRVTVDQVEAGTPLLWLLSSSNRQAAATDWKVEVTPQADVSPKTSAGLPGMPALHDRLELIAAGLARWLPSAQLGYGEVRWPGQTLTLQRTDWQDRTLTIHGLAWRNFSGDVTSAWPAQGPTSVQITTSDGTTRLDWSGAGVKGTASIWGQPLKIETQFPADHWMPASADFDAPDWTLPAERLKLGSPYASVRGRAHLAWSQNRYTISAHAAAIPRDATKSAPPFEAQIEAYGDTRGATVTALQVLSPFATANLSAPVALDFAQGFQAGVAKLTVNADLSKQSWFDARGQVHGLVGVSGSGQQDFNLECSDLRLGDLNLPHAVARGTLQWPRLAVAALDLQLDDSSRVSGRGAIDLVRRELSDGTLQAQLSGAWFAHWLPEGAPWSRAELSATFSGPLDAPTHAGQAAITGASLGALQPMDLAATWRGRGLALDDFTVRATAGTSSLEAAGTLDAQQVQLRSLSLGRTGQPPWTLSAPARIAWAPEWQAGPLRLEHGDGFISVALTGGADRTWRFDAANVESPWLNDWLALTGPAWRINTAHSEGKLAEGKLVFTAQLNGQIVLPSLPADVRLRAHGDAAGIELDELSTTIGERVVTSASGHLGVAWDARTASHVQVDWKSPLKVDAQVTPDSPLWAVLTDLTGATVETPRAEARIGGTLEQPTGELRVTAARLALSQSGLKERLPEITNLTLEARADTAGLTVDTFSARLDEQVVQAHGKLPARRADWASLRRDPLAFLWQRGEGHLELADADLARLARRVPNFLAAQGKLTTRLDLASGGALTGELHLRNAALRPIDPLGAVQEINADLALADRRLEIQSWSAKLGGEPVELRGTIELPPESQPKVALELQGKNLPLVRRAGLIVRSDLILKAATQRNGATLVTGTVTLHDSVVMADLSVLRPTGQTRARRQPPYFSVEVEPFRDWLLAVDLLGPRAVKIRTPVFNGVASTRFKLGGTLGEPRAVGEVTVDEGRVLFPFATFTVQLGAIRLSEADPFHPQLAVNAQSRYHDYLLRLEANGPLESPHVLLSSNPSLDAAQVLLMVTSGQSPETDPAAATGSARLARLGTYLGQGLILGSGADASRLEVSSGSQVSAQGRETYEFTYRLNDKWALVGEYDEYDEYNLGVKWRAYVQEGDASAKK